MTWLLPSWWRRWLGRGKVHGLRMASSASNDEPHFGLSPTSPESANSLRLASRRSRAAVGWIGLLQEMIRAIVMVLGTEAFLQTCPGGKTWKPMDILSSKRANTSSRVAPLKWKEPAIQGRGPFRDMMARNKARCQAGTGTELLALKERTIQTPKVSSRERANLDSAGGGPGGRDEGLNFEDNFGGIPNFRNSYNPEQHAPSPFIANSAPITRLVNTRSLQLLDATRTSTST